MIKLKTIRAVYNAPWTLVKLGCRMLPAAFMWLGLFYMLTLPQGVMCSDVRGGGPWSLVYCQLFIALPTLLTVILGGASMAATIWFCAWLFGAYPDDA